MKLSKLFIAILLVGFLSGCHVFFPTAAGPEADGTDTPSAVQPSVDGVTLDTFKNLSFYAPALEKEVQLNNGKYEAGSGDSYESLQLLDAAGFGDLNGDGNADAAVLLAENSGGSGVFVYLVALVKQTDGYSQSTPLLIDDRPQVDSLTIANNHIRLEAKVHGLADSMANPTMAVVEEYQLTHSRLTLTNLVSTISSAERSITISAPSDYAEVESTFTVTGNMPIGPFENSLVYRFYDSAGNLLIEAPLAVESDGVGGPATINAAISVPTATSGSVLIFTLSEQSMANGTDLCLASLNLIVK